jgi:hypothetical protein
VDKHFAKTANITKRAFSAHFAFKLFDVIASVDFLRGFCQLFLALC